MLSSMTLDPLTMQPSGIRRAVADQPEDWQGQARADIPFVDPIVKLLDPSLSEQEKSGAAGDIIGQGALFGGLGEGMKSTEMPTVAPDLPAEESSQPQLGTGRTLITPPPVTTLDPSHMLSGDFPGQKTFAPVVRIPEDLAPGEISEGGPRIFNIGEE